MDPGKIDEMLGDLAGVINVDTSVPVSPHDPYLERMSEALGKPRGIAIDAGSTEAAVSLRWRYYNARRWARSKLKLNSYDDLIVKVKGTEVLLIPGPNTSVRDL